MNRFLPALAFSLCALCHAQERTFDRTLNVNGPVNLDLTTDSGGIEVTHGASGTVHIRGYLRASHSWFAAGDVESRMRQLEQNPPIQQSGNTIRAGYAGDKGLLKGISLRLVITAPAETQVRARVDSGGIHVEGVRGPVDCKADSGGIEANDIDADVHVETDSGGIHIRNVRGPVYARADSGGIDANDIRGSIDVATDSGGIHLSHTAPAPVRARADSGGATLRLAHNAGYDIRIHSESGRISVADLTVHGTISEHRAEGTLRGGGPRVDIDVDSGNVDIE